MLIHAKGISLYIENIVCAAALSGERFSVHSIYERTLNLELRNGSIVAIQKESSPVSPLTLLVEDSAPIFFSEDIFVGMEAEIIVRSDGYSAQIEQITLGSHHLIVRKDAPRFMTEVPQALPPCCYILFEEKAKLLKPYYIKEEDFASARARQIKREAQTSFLNGAYGDAASLLASLIGLGSGLTPSGDDFLTGVATGIYASRQLSSPFTQALFSTLRDNINRTHAISASFITAALGGHSSLPLIYFVSNPSEDALRKVAAIGHSSGLDALEGFLYYQKLIHSPND